MSFRNEEQNLFFVEKPVNLVAALRQKHVKYSVDGKSSLQPSLIGFLSEMEIKISTVAEFV